jgi:RES domain
VRLPKIARLSLLAKPVLGEKIGVSRSQAAISTLTLPEDCASASSGEIVASEADYRKLGGYERATGDLCSTVPSLCALEKRVHVFDPALLPDQVMVEYEAPDDLPKHEITLDDLPADWGARETRTQSIGDTWLDAGTATLLSVPSVIVPIGGAPDRKVLINHRRTDAARIRVVNTSPFTFDPRLFFR